jgi:hypothetical protein
LSELGRTIGLGGCITELFDIATFAQRREPFRTDAPDIGRAASFDFPRVSILYYPICGRNLADF